MIGEAKFHTSCEDGYRIVKDAGLFSSKILKPIYPADMPSIMRSMGYRERWQRCLDEGWYNMVLTDRSVLQFKRTASTVSYSYLQCPFIVPSFEEFAFQKIGEEWVDYEDVLRDEYEFFNAGDAAERSVTPVRYDYEPDIYRNGYHPAGHFHFGIGNETRVGSRNILFPSSFVLFIVRQFYPVGWERIIDHKDREIITKDVRENVQAVDSKLYHSLDFCEMYLD